MSEFINDQVDNLSQARRWFLTINNPYGAGITDVDLTKTNLPIKNDFYDLSVINTNLDCFNFKNIEITLNKDTLEEHQGIVKRPFFKDIESVKKYFQRLEHFKYCIFQEEMGEKEQTTHLQVGIIFNIAKRFQTIKSYFPTSYIDRVRGSNSQLRDYCTKKETRVNGPYEIGDFAEERSRTDIKEFLEMLTLNISDSDLMATYPSLFLKEYNKLDKIRNKIKFEEFRLKLRDIIVTYIYGPSRSGKTSYIVNKFGLGNFYNVDTYYKGPFDNYLGEQTIVFDEYDSQIDCTLMNKLIDRYPVQMPCRFENKWACYKNIFIVSNMPLTGQYNDENRTKRNIRDAFIARIDNVIRFDSYGIKHFEKIKQSIQ